MAPHRVCAGAPSPTRAEGHGASDPPSSRRPWQDGAVLGIEDRMAIHELLALYGHLIDERRWDDLDQVFTADAVYDGTDFGMPVTRSLAELVAEWTSEMGLTRHPLAHHATNIVITGRDDGTAFVRSKGLGVGKGGRVGSVTYVDEAVRTERGWRLRSRTVTLRRPS